MERIKLGLLVYAGCQVCITAWRAWNVPSAHGETTALCRACQAVVSDAAQFLCAEQGAWPQINKAGAKVPFNILCQVLSWDKALESC